MRFLLENIKGNLLKCFNTIRNMLNGFAHKVGCKSALAIQQYTGRGATVEQFCSIMKSSGIPLVWVV